MIMPKKLRRLKMWHRLFCIPCDYNSQESVICAPSDYNSTGISVTKFRGSDT